MWCERVGWDGGWRGSGVESDSLFYARRRIVLCNRNGKGFSDIQQVLLLDCILQSNKVISSREMVVWQLEFQGNINCLGRTSLC